MIGLDTNVVVRYLVRDDPVQFGQAASRIEAAVAEGEELFLNRIVLCEVVWVLESAYGYGRSDIADVLESILLTKEFVIEDRGAVWRALERYRRGPADFSDYLIGETSAAFDCPLTVTFDRALEGESDFELL